MQRLKITLSGLLFALFLAACDSDSPSTKTGFLSDTPGRIDSLKIKPSKPGCLI